MATNNLDYLKFSAYSIKDLITRKLTEDTKFTDQIYEGSNLAIIIDIFSHMAQCLLYSLNNTAAESMFSDTRIYENMNRLVKFIGYNPHGISAPTATLTLDQSVLFKSSNQQSFILHKYSAIDVGKTDRLGHRIYYSLVENVVTNSNSEFETLFYNGLWRLYSTVFTSNGEKYQTFSLTNLESNSADNRYVVDGMIHVYVRGNDGTFQQYKKVDQGLFTDNNVSNGSRIYASAEKIFNLRLNENKNYEITFGNGQTGYIPDKDSEIYVFYLESNGPDGELEPYDIDGKNLVHNKSLFGISDDMYRRIFNVGDESDASTSNIAYSTIAKWTNTRRSSAFVAEETVDDIRRNAPEWFKLGNRLITASDYEYFVKNRFKDNIIDVKCQNNWQYISTFFQWLYNLGNNGNLIKKLKRPKLANYYINQNKLQRFDLAFADSADSNNVYLWIKMRNDSDIYKKQIDEELLNIKALTQEPVYLSPISVNFAICAADKDDALNYIINDVVFDKNNESYLEITLDDNALYSNNDIQQKVVLIIKEFFDEGNFTLGQTIDFSILANRILNLTSVVRIRTVYIEPRTGASRIINGLSFATWSSRVIDAGDDLDVSSVSRTLEVFQFPTLYRSADLATKIKIIRKSISNVNAIQY